MPIAPQFCLDLSIFAPELFCQYLAIFAPVARHFRFDLANFDVAFLYLPVIRHFCFDLANLAAIVHYFCIALYFAAAAPQFCLRSYKFSQVAIYSPKLCDV